MHPYDEGYVSYDSKEECPYSEGTDDWDNWHVGYEDAMAESEEEGYESRSDEYEH